jgi:hypothetical protein
MGRKYTASRTRSNSNLSSEGMQLHLQVQGPVAWRSIGQRGGTGQNKPHAQRAGRSGRGGRVAGRPWRRVVMMASRTRSCASAPAVPPHEPSPAHAWWPSLGSGTTTAALWLTIAREVGELARSGAQMTWWAHRASSQQRDALAPERRGSAGTAPWVRGAPTASKRSSSTRRARTPCHGKQAGPTPPKPRFWSPGHRWPVSSAPEPPPGLAAPASGHLLASIEHVGKYPPGYHRED